jgi:hypothetical protein
MRGGVAAPLLAVVAAIVYLACSGAGSAAVAQLPFTVTNNSGRGDATYIYVIARNSAGTQGYVDGSGTWHAWSFPSSIPNGPVAAPDVSIAGPGNGASKTITLPPSLAGGRIYVSMGSKLFFFLTTNGLVEPAPWVSTDANANVLYDWTEFARASSSGNGIFINTTTVDMFSIPLTVSVTSSAGVTQTQGIPGNRAGIMSAISALGSPWSSLITTRASDGLQLRALAPVHAIANGSFSSTYLDAYITAVWSYYASHTLTVQTSLGNFTGRTSGNNWTFTSSTGASIGTLTKPTTSDTFACAGGLQPGGQPNETAILAVGARVCAALNRATLSTSSRVEFDTQPTTDPSQFYGQSASNLFSKTIHANSLNGLAYGFSYDDVGGFAPTIDQPDPASAGMTIGSFGTGGGTGGGGTAPATPTGLAVTATTSSSVSLSWNASSGATSYNVLRGGVKIASATGTTYTDSGLAASTSYVYSVQAVNASGTSAASGSVTGTTLASGGGGGGVSATSTIQAESFSAQSGTQTETTTDTGGGQDVGYIANGDWLQYNNVNFGTAGLHTFSARVASGAAAGVSGTVEVHLDSLSNPSIGSFSIGNTGGWQTWKTTPANISTTTGTHTVFLKFVSGQSADFVNVNWFTFS